MGGKTASLACFLLLVAIAGAVSGEAQFKLDFGLAELADAHAEGGDTSSIASSYNLELDNGRVKADIILVSESTEISPGGFELISESSEFGQKTLTGWIEISKLEELALLEEVSFIMATISLGEMPGLEIPAPGDMAPPQGTPPVDETGLPGGIPGSGVVPPGDIPGGITPPQGPPGIDPTKPPGGMPGDLNWGAGAAPDLNMEGMPDFNLGEMPGPGMELPEGWEVPQIGDMKLDPMLLQIVEMFEQGKDVSGLANQVGLEIDGGKAMVSIRFEVGTLLDCCGIEEERRFEEFGSLNAIAWVPIPQLKSASNLEGVQFISIPFETDGGGALGKLSFELVELLKAIEEGNAEEVAEAFQIDYALGRVRVEVVLGAETTEMPEVEGFEEVESGGMLEFNIVNGYIPAEKISELGALDEIQFVAASHKFDEKIKPVPTIPPEAPGGLQAWQYAIAIFGAFVVLFILVKWYRRMKYLKM